MNNYFLPLSILISIIPTLSGLIAIYVKLRSDVIKLEVEVKHSRQIITDYSKNIEKLTDQIAELNNKYMSFLIELSRCKLEKKC